MAAPAASIGRCGKPLATWSPLRCAGCGARGSGRVEEFWALKDVNLEVRQGEVVGIIGRNGAGKSTLLKILSRITAPSRGRAELRGRVGSLLEVGTGFHAELTGRENVFLNGSIIGMSRRDIVKKFDEIVEFSGVERFLDTPVKRYSSGMYIRLAFAVAAHLDPEILIVDEVLAVGDAEFQKKCLAKMGDVARGGRTVLFVSHNIAAIQRAVHARVLIERGLVSADGEPVSVTRHYLAPPGSCPGERQWPDEASAPGNAHVRLVAVRVRNAKYEVVNKVDVRDKFFVEVEYKQFSPDLRATAILHFINEEAVRLFATNDFNNLQWWNTIRTTSKVRAVCHVPANFLAEGRIDVLAAVGSYNPNVVHALESDAVSFTVVDQSDGDGVRGPYVGNWPGVVRPMLEWSIQTEDL